MPEAPSKIKLFRPKNTIFSSCHGLASAALGLQELGNALGLLLEVPEELLRLLQEHPCLGASLLVLRLPSVRAYLRSVHAQISSRSG